MHKRLTFGYLAAVPPDKGNVTSCVIKNIRRIRENTPDSIFKMSSRTPKWPVLFPLILRSERIFKTQENKRIMSPGRSSSVCKGSAVGMGLLLDRKKAILAQGQGKTRSLRVHVQVRELPIVRSPGS